MLQIAIEEQERREEELRIEEEKKEKARKEAEERRLEELRKLAEKEAAEARRSAELAQTSRRIDVSMTEDSEWGHMGPYLTSLVMLPFLEEASCAEGLGRAQSRSVATARSQGPKRKGLPLVKLPCWYC